MPYRHCYKGYENSGCAFILLFWILLWVRYIYMICCVPISTIVGIFGTSLWSWNDLQTNNFYIPFWLITQKYSKFFTKLNLMWKVFTWTLYTCVWNDSRRRLYIDRAIEGDKLHICSLTVIIQIPYQYTTPDAFLITNAPDVTINRSRDLNNSYIRI